VLFACLALNVLGKWLPKSAAILAFIGLGTVTASIFGHFIGQAVTAIPHVLENTIPRVVELATQYGIDLPFSDPGTLRAFAMEGLKEELTGVAGFAELTTKHAVYVIIGLVVACGIFVNPKLEQDDATRSHSNLYSTVARLSGTRFVRFFRSFQTVMGAQVIISAVNTFFTGLFVLGLAATGSPLPYSFVIIVVTFLCGILPIVGNLISNTVIFCVALTQSPQLAVAALVFLIVLHKFEYFLNSKIIGGRIKNPMWLTLIGLLVGERLMGIPGMILAPVVLHYIKVETTDIQVQPLVGI
jgi:predicted PurR-regulated permease PerM